MSTTFAVLAISGL